MSESNENRLRSKPTKPYADFPLFAHATGRWAKKIRGKLHYFGKWNDPDGALRKYLDQRDDLHAGRTPRLQNGCLTIVDLCNRYLTSKKHRLDSGEITERTFHDYFCASKRVIEVFGRNRIVDDLAASDFETFRCALSESLGPVALANAITRVRMIFKFGYDDNLVERPMRYGQSFRKPASAVLRKSRHNKKDKHGARMLEADQLRKVIEASKQPLRAMILLAVNCGFGQSDISKLPKSALDLDRGWVDFPRPKTGIERRCPLWPETIAAIQKAADQRPPANLEADANLAFITKYGHRWVRTSPNGKHTPDDAVGKEFAKLLVQLDLKRPGLSFYALRHTFETIGGDSLDQVAVNFIMGHAEVDMASRYRERISDDRLRKVTDTIHQWLFNTTISH